MKYVTIQARNIANMQTIEHQIKMLSADNPDNIKKWLKGQFRNWLINSYPNTIEIVSPNSDDPEWLTKALREGQKVYNIYFEQEFLNQINHTIDFLRTLPETRSINYTVEDAFRATEEWDRRREREIAKKGQEALLNMQEDGIELIKKYSDGFSWVKVFGEKSLDREGKLMNHCVGSYYNEVKHNKTTIYSLRDTSNRPHCTIEIKKATITQIKGYKNTPVNSKYIKYVKNFITEKYVPIGMIVQEELVMNRLIYLNNILYALDKLPKSLICEHNIDLIGRSNIRLPENLVVKGSLYLNNSKEIILPKILIVHEYLILDRAKVLNIPERLEVKGLASFSRSNITKLPDNMFVGNDLELDRTKIEILPRNLTVRGNLNLVKTLITSLPLDLKVEGKILIDDARINSFRDSKFANKLVRGE